MPYSYGVLAVLKIVDEIWFLIVVVVIIETHRNIMMARTTTVRDTWVIHSCSLILTFLPLTMYSGCGSYFVFAWSSSSGRHVFSSSNVLVRINVSYPLSW